MYETLIKEFEDSLKDNVFETMAFNFAKKELQESNNNIRFLIGVPGSGKSFLLAHIYPTTPILASTLTKEDIDKNLHKELIIIDEAQMLDNSLIEYIRTLTDTKKYNFLLSMHLKEAKEILEKDHFKSRSIDVIELKPITKQEMTQYINVKLLKNNANHIFSKKEFDIIYKYTKGNFRYIKKFVKTLFELLDFAISNNIQKHSKINNCLITMTAIKLGLENE